jgi:hypothetical protein
MTISCYERICLTDFNGKRNASPWAPGKIFPLRLSLEFQRKNRFIETKVAVKLC